MLRRWLERRRDERFLRGQLKRLERVGHRHMRLPTPPRDHRARLQWLREYHLGKGLQRSGKRRARR